MKTYRVQYSCGCCFEEVMFEDDDSAQKALKKAIEEAGGLSSSATITDDLGNIYDDIDLFYGFSDLNDDTPPLLRLVNKLF